MYYRFRLMMVHVARMAAIVLLGLAWWLGLAPGSGPGGSLVFGPGWGGNAGGVQGAEPAAVPPEAAF